jgi:DNA-binding NarL/FixJ family response regulator
MTANGTERRALVVEASPRWRAALADALRAGGWMVTAVATAPEALAGQPYHLAVLEVAPEGAALPETLTLLSHLASAGTRPVLFASQPAETLPPELAQHPLVLGVLARRDFRAEALLELTQALGPRSLPAPPLSTSPEGPRVLVVEDDVQWRRIYEELLLDAGYAPYFAVSYGEARGWLQRVEFALALVDLNLASSAAPEGNRDGFYLLRATKQRGVPAVVVSALGDPADIDRAYDEFGIFAFVEKEGFDRRNFLRLLEEAINAGRAAAAEPEHTNPAFEALTPREREVLALLIQGHTNRQIAEALLITPNTTKKHVDHILQKLGVSTRAGAVAAALKDG